MMENSEKKVFILYGAANRGKTTTFNLLFNQICRKHSEDLIYFKRNEYRADFVAVFKKGGITIGLYSSGDNEHEVSHNLYHLDAYRCDYVFGISRTRGGSCVAVNRYAELVHGSQDIICWIEKDYANNEVDELEQNTKTGKKLFQEFIRLFSSE
ncbi:hypothetical protein [Neisseria sp. CCUG12390]|uniref:hypothetical protein n=1 Tax=Neisseria sp. CCUG12390 TaxID=3392035 RepID=UPI003A10118D